MLFRSERYAIDAGVGIKAITAQHDTQASHSLQHLKATHDAILNSMGATEDGTSLEKAKKAITQHGVDIPTIGDAIGHVVAGAKNSGTVTPNP